MNKEFKERVKSMNLMYKLPVLEVPSIGEDVVGKLKRFKLTLLDEVNEIDDIVECAKSGVSELDVVVAIADVLGDIIVYCRSEAMKYGIPLEDVLNVIMDSNESKLGADGKPIYDENGKFLKGPAYWKPEPKIKYVLEKLSKKD
ncbi:pyrophosphatase [Pseudomonas sp. MIACH]|uniref:pyrophosphatase n=1 Tax=Pseudomonas sp. MIACH TaxID=1078355 RepID=UPI00069EF126|nr:pyrophosphatase [Pseudomonas sp. MIACH]